MKLIFIFDRFHKGGGMSDFYMRVDDSRVEEILDHCFQGTKEGSVQVVDANTLEIEEEYILAPGKEIRKIPAQKFLKEQQTHLDELTGLNRRALHEG